MSMRSASWEWGIIEGSIARRAYHLLLLAPHDQAAQKISTNVRTQSMLARQHEPLGWIE
jgi:hypothetical protein